MLPMGSRSRWLLNQDKHGLIGLAVERWNGDWPDEVLDGEVFLAGVNFGTICEGVNRLKTNAEASDRSAVLFFCALGDTADAANVRAVKGLAAMSDSKLSRGEGEEDCPRCPPALATSESVLRVL
jgi:hypothetical protein